MEYQELKRFDVQLVFPAQFGIMPHPDPLGRMCASVINIPPELRENKLPVRACCHSICGRHRSQTLFGRSKWLRMAHCSQWLHFTKRPLFSRHQISVYLLSTLIMSLWTEHNFFVLFFEKRKKDQQNRKFLAGHETKNQAFIANKIQSGALQSRWF